MKIFLESSEEERLSHEMEFYEDAYLRAGFYLNLKWWRLKKARKPIERDDELEEELQFDIAMIEDEEAYIYKYDFNDCTDGQIFIEENITTADDVRGVDWQDLFELPDLLMNKLINILLILSAYILIWTGNWREQSLPIFELCWP